MSRVFGLLAPACLLVIFSPLGQAATRIGSESAVTVPPAAYYSSLVNVRPGPGEVVSNNPPIFSWFYNTNHLAGGELNPNGWNDTIWLWTNSFIFQVASNASFTGNLQVNVTTPMNFYNFIGPLDTNATRQFWWRVKYVRNGTPYWTNGYTFTVANGAAKWDRSMFADPNYLATNGVHPIFCFRAGEQASIYSWMQSQPDFTALLYRASLCTNQSYFTSHAEWGTNASPNPNFAAINPPDGLNRVSDLGAVLNLWTLSGDNRWTNANTTGWLVTNLQHCVNWYSHPSNNWAWNDYGNAGNTDFPLLLAATYDWMYDYLGSDTSTFKGQLRTNAYEAIRRSLLFQTHYNFWSDSGNGGPPSLRTGFDYPQTTESVPPSAWPKFPNSHASMTTHTFLPLIIVAQQEGGAGRFAFDWMFNYMLARTTPYAGFAAHHAGPYGYVYGHTFNNKIITAMMQLEQAYPQGQLYRTDFARRFPEWYTRLHPYRMRRLHGPYGDGTPYNDYGNAGHIGHMAVGYDMAAITHSGIALQAYNLNAEYHAYGSGPQSFNLPLRWHFRTPPAPETNSTSAVYPEDGYVIASQISPSEFGCYTNGVGFSMRARPRGSVGGHDVYTDGSVDMWAYGTQLTDGGGAGLDNYGYSADSSPTLLINGLGQNSPATANSPLRPVQASICNFTNSGTNFVYACADLTGLFTNGYHPFLNLVTKVKRHVLFPRSKYWVLYDEFSTTSNATFMWRWHVPWVFRYAPGSSALANETAFTGDRYGSNSLAMTNYGFTYVAGNYTDVNYNDTPPRIPVHVMFANAPNSYGIFNATGTGSLNADTANAIGTSATNSTLNPFINGGQTRATANPDRAVGMWVTNRVAATNWHFMTVIVPQRPGVAAPVFQSLDENTVAVTYDGVTETTTFGTNYTGAYSFRVEVVGASGGGSVPPRVPTGVGGPGFVPRIVTP